MKFISNYSFLPWSTLCGHGGFAVESFPKLKAYKFQVLEYYHNPQFNAKAMAGQVLRPKGDGRIAHFFDNCLFP